MTPPAPSPAPGVAGPLPPNLQHGYLDESLVQAMTPVTERTIRHSIELNPEILSDTLFPIIGSAVRKAVAHAFEKMIQAMNTTMEHSLSPQSIRWRLEAKRTGKSFAEIVVLHTLLYRVEQVFLIEKKGGLLLQHVAVDPAMSEHSEVTAAMLTAIQDFVHDSFRTAEGEEIGAVSLGSMTLWIESGPEAVLAAAIRGNPPQDLREVMHDTLVALHQDHLQPLALASSKPEDFAPCAELMKGCLQEQRLEPRAKPAPRYTPFFWLSLTVAILLSIWLEFALYNHIRWGRFERQLRARPGIVITQSSVSGSHFWLTGLRDPRADDPVVIARGRGLPVEKLHLDLAPFQSLEGELVRRPSFP